MQMKSKRSQIDNAMGSTPILYLQMGFEMRTRILDCRALAPAIQTTHDTRSHLREQGRHKEKRISKVLCRDKGFFKFFIYYLLSFLCNSYVAYLLIILNVLVIIEFIFISNFKNYIDLNLIRKYEGKTISV